jgi:very-short-patch-repair endonuclease
MNYQKLSDEEKQKIIEKLYITNKKSFGQIAEELSTYANKIRRDAIKFKIPIRDKSEAQKNALTSGVTDHPTKGKTRSIETKQKIGLGVMNNWNQLSDQELKNRQDKAREQWLKLNDDQRSMMTKMANEAVRLSGKTGSKLEKFLLSKLIENKIKVEFHKEQTLLNTKLQIDLFLPELNIAIEVDGPSHFLPVWGDDVLKRNIKYDNKKTGLLLGKGCVIIRIRQTKDFSPARANLIFDNLLKHIEDIKVKFPDQDNRIIELGDN